MFPKPMLAGIATGILISTGTFALGAAPKKLAACGATKALLVGNKQVMLKSVYVDRLHKIKKSGVFVVYPTTLPARFSVEDISVTNDEDNQPNYQLSYIDRKKKLSFTIETAYSGIGDGPDGDRTLKGNSKVFGTFTVDVFKPRSEGNDTDEIYYISSWMADAKRQAAREKKDQPFPGRYYHFLGNGITDKEAVAIIESLTPIK